MRLSGLFVLMDSFVGCVDWLPRPSRRCCWLASSGRADGWRLWLRGHLRGRADGRLLLLRGRLLVHADGQLLRLCGRLVGRA